MCAERIQRLLMAIMVGVVLFLFNNSMVMVGNIIGGFIIVMIIIWAFTNFCPSIWAFKKMFGACDFNKEKENE